MTKFETLYKRTKTGAIQYYSISTAIQDNWRVAQIIKESGQLNTTKPIIHIEKITTGKNIGKVNETTPEQQAELQAESDWKKKKDEGYKSLADLNILYPGTVHVAEIFNTGYGTLDVALEEALPQYNSDSSGNCKPMLAKAVNWKTITYPCFVQPKLDGVRCLMVIERLKDGSGTIKFLSRSGKEYTTLKHITRDLIYYMKTDLNRLGVIIDGELYSDLLNFQEIVSAVKAQKENSLKLQFRAYDLISDDLQDVRIAKLYQLIDSINSPHITKVNTSIVTNKSEVTALHDQFVQQGYEGAMIRNPKGWYGRGQRSSDLLKVKEFDENEFAFKCFEHGQRGVEDLIAVCWNKDGIEFRAKVVGTKSEKEDLYLLNDYSEGKSFTIKHFGFTEDGLPRFPIGKNFRNYE